MKAGLTRFWQRQRNSPLRFKLLSTTAFAMLCSIT